MEEKRDVCEVCKGHKGNCSGPFHCQFHIIRWILGIAIIFIVFGMGVKIGEFKGALENGGEWGYGYHGMMRYNQPMMLYYGNAGYQTDKSLAPASNTATPVKK